MAGLFIEFFWLGNAPVVKVGDPISDASFSFFTLLDAGLKSPSSDSGLT